MYSRRKVIAEPPFGQIKNREFRSFLRQGIEKVRGEWSLIALSHHLLKLHKATRRGPAMGTSVLLAA